MLGETTFKIFVLQLKYTRGFQYLLIHDPSEHNLTMPQIGEACKVCFAEANGKTGSTADAEEKQAELTSEQKDDACHAIVEALTEARSDPDPPSIVNKLASFFLQRPLTPDEVKELLNMMQGGNEANNISQSMIVTQYPVTVEAPC